MQITGLSGAALELRLRGLLGEERAVQVEFLLSLGEFDRRAEWEKLGYPTLWEYCRQVLVLLDGQIFRRTNAMKILRRFPQVEAHLRDGRLSMTTLVELRGVLTEENAAELFEKASKKSVKDVEYLVACLKPREIPETSLRKLPARGLPAAQEEERNIDNVFAKKPEAILENHGLAIVRDRAMEEPVSPALASPKAVRAAAVPLSSDRWSLRLVVEGEFKELLDRARVTLDHVVPDGDPVAIIRYALEQVVKKAERRNSAAEKKARAPEEKSPDRTATIRERRKPAARPAVPAAVRREVWIRDGACCAWAMPGGGVCGSTRQIELDHIAPWATGGATVASNLRLLCRDHNVRHAKESFGSEFMEKFRRKSHFR